ncbi:ATP-binding protein [Streptomyces sp. NBC_01410]|uniref:ATP-binding protein n=1 Tax=Streptomyces sp. NBC_01410 TaxID=2903856 RepID=UPI00325227BE
MRFTSSPRGARLARRLVSHRLNVWGHPYASDVNESVSLIAAELTGNAVRHGHVPGRDFHLRLAVTTSVIRLEVTDTRSEKQPTVARTADLDADGGRGLFLVSQLATCWAVTPRPDGPGKTVWAELHVQQPGGADRLWRRCDHVRTSVPKGLPRRGLCALG